MSTSTKIMMAGALGGVISILPLAAFAQTNTPNTCETQVGITTLKGATLAQVQQYGACLVTQRQTALQAASTRVSQMQRVSSSTQQSLQSTISSTEATLTGIEAKFNADTDVPTAITDVRSVLGSVRVFALVLPRTWIYATADREMTISGDLQTVDNELITKNNTASSSVQAINAPLFTDITTQLGTVNTQSSNADATVQPLVPDNGSTTTLQANTAALTSARGMLQTGQTAIKAIVNDINQIRANLHV